MGELVTLLGQHSDEQPPTLVIQATPVWEAALVHVKLQECGLGVNLSVMVWSIMYITTYNMGTMSDVHSALASVFWLS